MSVLSIPIEQCMKTIEVILRKLKLCCICNQVPVPLLRNINDFVNVYCTECAINSKITRQNATLDDKYILSELIIDCKNFCGATFSYNSFENYCDHINQCNVIQVRNENSLKYKKPKLKKCVNQACFTDIEKKLKNFETIINENIENVKNHQNERIFKLESVQVKMNNQIMNLINNKSNSEDFQSLDYLIKREFKDQLNIQGTLNQQFNVKLEKLIEEFDVFQVRMADKYDEYTIIINSKLTILEENISKFNNFLSESFRISSEKLSNFIEKSEKIMSIDKENPNNERKISFISNHDFNSYKSLCISELNSKLINLVSCNYSSIKFHSLKLSDSMIQIDPTIYPIENLKSIEDNQTFQKEYESINNNLNLEIEKYINFKPLYGNISKVIENTDGHWIYSMIINKDQLITFSSDFSIKVWNLGSYNLIKEIKNAHGKGNYIYSFLLYPKNDILISGGNDTNIRFWDKEYEVVYCLNNDKSVIYHMVESNNILIVAGGKLNGSLASINFYDLNSKLLINKIITNHKSSIWKVLLLYSNDVLLTASICSNIKVWNVNDYSKQKSISKNIKSQYSITGHKGRIDSMIQLKCDNNVIVTSDDNGTIIFSSINNDYQILNMYQKSFYDQNKTQTIFKHPTFVCELFKYKLLVSVTCFSSLLFWNLDNYQILRNVKLKELLLNTIVRLDDDEGIIFSLGKYYTIIWK